MKGLKPIVSALMLAGIASPSFAQVCDPLDPPFLAEGPISAVIANLDLSGTITSMGIPITVPNTAPVTTPTAVLNMAIFADPTPFPGRADPGFVGGTVIATGCVKLDPTPGGTAHTYLADAITSDVNENVLLGVTTSVPVVSPTGGVSLHVLGTPVSLLQDARMPAEPLRNAFGFPVDPLTVPLLSPASVEGYFGDTDNTLHAFLVEVDGGTLADPVNPQISIQRFRCTGDLQVQGGIFLGDADGTPPAPACVFTNPPYSIRLFNVEGNQEIPFAAGDLDVLNGDPLASPEFCTYDLRFAPATCPANVRIELHLNGVKVAEAATTPDAPPANAAPVAVADSYSTPQDTPLVVAAPGVLANDTDADGDALTAGLISGPLNGDLIFGPDGAPPDGSFTYTPELGFTGTDSFTYVAVDSKGALSAPVTVTITVTPPGNVAPVAADDAVTTAEDTPVTIPVLANDTDANAGDVLTVTAAGPAASGTVVVNADSTVTYTPNLNFNGTDSFAYTISDGQGGTASATVTVTVTPVNDAPVAVADAVTTPEDTPVVIPAANLLANDTDVDSPTLTLTAVGGAVNGTVALANGNVTFTPNANFNGPARFSYTVSDGAATATGTVNVTVTPVNDAPVANADTASTTAPTPVTINVLANDTDVDGNLLSVTAVTQAAGGSVSTNGISVTYTPNAAFSGTDSFTYTVSDGTATAVGNVTVNVAPAPVLGVDLDIVSLVTPPQVRVNTTVLLRATIRNVSTVNQPGTATLVGTRAGVQVYSQSVPLSIAPGSQALVSFPNFIPRQTGIMTWTLTVADGNPDLDVATRNMNVLP